MQVVIAFLAEVAFALGDRAEAIALAQRACDEREPIFLIFARHLPNFAWLREQPEWPAMLGKLDGARVSARSQPL